MNQKSELQKIRQQRKELEKEEDKQQKRRVEIIEYEDGTFCLKGYAYSLPLQLGEVEPAFKAWLDNSLESGVTLNENIKD